MINLLPGDEKRQIRAARTNVLLLRYLVVIAFAFAFLALIMGGSYYFLTRVNTSSQQVITSHGGAQPSAQSAPAAQSSTASLAQAQSFLSSEVSYSTILEHLGAILPSGVVLKSLSLSDSSFGRSTSLEFLLTNKSVATQLQNALQTSPYFSAVTPGTPTDNSSDSTYPVDITYTLTINRTIAQ